MAVRQHSISAPGILSAPIPKTVSNITPALFLEEIRLRAEVQPFDSPFQVGIQVGRFQFVCELEDFDADQKRELERLYRAGEIRFGFPGDFRELPFFFRCQRRTRSTSLASKSWIDNVL